MRQRPKVVEGTTKLKKKLPGKGGTMNAWHVLFRVLPNSRSRPWPTEREGQLRVGAPDATHVKETKEQCVCDEMCAGGVRESTPPQLGPARRTLHA